MEVNIFDELRERLETQPVSVGRFEALPSKESTDAESNLIAQLQRLQFFRSNVFPAMRDFLLTILAIQRERIRAAEMERIVTLQYPLATPPETRYGFPLPLEKPQSPHYSVEQVLLTFAPQAKPARHFMISFRIKALESAIEVDAVLYDELGRRGQSVAGDTIQMDSSSEFKGGEFLLATQKLLNLILKKCFKEVM